MVDVEAIQELYRYNHWANDRVFEAVSILTHEEFAKNLGSSHSSVRRHSCAHRLGRMDLASTLERKFAADRLSRREFFGPGCAEGAMVGARCRAASVHRDPDDGPPPFAREVCKPPGANLVLPALASDVPRRESFDLSPRSTDDNAATVGGVARFDRLSRVPRRAGGSRSSRGGVGEALDSSADDTRRSWQGRWHHRPRIRRATSCQP